MSKKVPEAICVFGARFMLEQVQHLENQIDGVQTGKDIEYVHQMRVASRRLRNGLNLFRECFPGKTYKAWLDDVRNITHALGNARDMDIQIAELNLLYTDDLEPSYKPGYARLLLRLKQSRTKAQKKINKTIFMLQKEETLSGITDALFKLGNLANTATLFTRPLYEKSCDSILAELTEFLSYQPFIHDPENIDKLHAMRIAGKHLRYTMEVFAPLYDGALDPFIILMKNIQSLLGEIHDNDVWVNWLPKFIEKEQERVEDYFGNTGPLIRLLPGLNHLIEDRQQARDKVYQTFLLTWDSITAENAWQALKSVVQTSIQKEEPSEQADEEPEDPQEDMPSPDQSQIQ